MAYPGRPDENRSTLQETAKRIYLDLQETDAKRNSHPMRGGADLGHRGLDARDHG
jgi:hypothetical protein